MRTDSGETARKGTTLPDPRSQHRKLLSDLGAFCQGCGRDYNFAPRVLEVDHVLPESDNGSDAYDNLTLLCPPCNNEKKDRLTLSGLQDQNRKNGHLLAENAKNIKRGRAQNTPARRRR